jgi:hypothetical protein
MEREIDDRNILDKFCEDFCNIVEQHCRYIIVSGFLVIASGRTRGTEDIDMIIEKISLEKWKLLFKELEENGFTCMQSSNPETVFEYLDDATSIRFIRENEPLPEMEIKFSKDELDQLQLNQRVKLELTGLNVWFSNVNINIAFKEEYLKSNKDLEDAKHLRIVYREMINEDEINRIKEMINRLRL